MKGNKIVPFIPKSLEYPNYSDRNYWRIRYENINGMFDWYDDYEAISPIIKQLNLPKRSNILHIGIGNSEFSEKMYDEGYKKSYNIDYSRNVIHFMKERNKRLRSSMIFETMNVLNLDYEDSQFDIVFDKAVFDCVLCGIDADSKATIFLNEVYRVLRPNGYYFLVSNSDPENRLKYLQKPNLKYDIFVNSITNDEKQTKLYIDNDINTNFMKKTHYIYICQKVEEVEEPQNEIVEKNELENKGELLNNNLKIEEQKKEENKEINIKNNNEISMEKNKEQIEDKDSDNIKGIKNKKDEAQKSQKSKTIKSKKSSNH